MIVHSSHSGHSTRTPPGRFQTFQPVAIIHELVRSELSSQVPETRWALTLLFSETFVQAAVDLLTSTSYAIVAQIFLYHIVCICLSVCLFVYGHVQFVSEISEVVRSGVWVGDCFIYSNSGKCLSSAVLHCAILCGAV